MKNILFSLILMLYFSSCAYQRESEQKAYSIYWQENNLCVEMPHPTMGIVTPGLADWRGVDLDNVVEDIYNECLKTHKSGDIVVWVRFENPQTDKYGNETMAYDDFEIATIPLEEAKKYKSGKFLDAEYKLTKGIHKAAFGSTDNADDYDEWLKSQSNWATDTEKAVRTNNTIELDYIAPNQYIAPTDTIDLDY